MPSEQQSKQRRLACTGRTDNGDMLSRRDPQIKVPQDLMSASKDAARSDFQARCAGRRRGSRRPGRHAEIFRRTQWLHHAQEDVPLGRISMGESGKSRPNRGQFENPIDQQKVRPGDLSRVQEVKGEKTPGHRRADGRLEAFIDERRQHPAAQRYGPFHQQALVLAAHCPLGAMGSNGGQPKQGVQVEPVQGAGMVADAQIPLIEKRLDGQWDGHGHQDQQNR